MKNLAVVILAAGEGTRMKSEKPKVLHGLCGKPMIRWVLATVDRLKPEKAVLVVGHKNEDVRKELEDEDIIFIEQPKQLGTGHALMQAASKLKSHHGDVLVLCGDVPLVEAETLRGLIDHHRKCCNSATILSARFDNPFGYGRVVRNPTGQVEKIVEEKDASNQEKEVREINSGIYCMQSPVIWDVLKSIRSDNAKKEYYLTDAIAILNYRQLKVDAYSKLRAYEIMGINSRVELSVAEKIKRRQLLTSLMASGVTILDPDNTYVFSDAKIMPDTLLYPGTMLFGKVEIGSGCVIGPNTIITDSKIGENSVITSSHVCESVVGNSVKIGPYSHLRPGSVIKDGAKIGNFSEIKKSVVEKGAKVNHLSYIGDTQLGKKANVGAGTITCNFDGVKKHKTIIGNGAFIGSNTNFIAPVKIGADALIGAGSTITEDVPAKALAIARSRQVNKKRK
ncbi:MAG: bifunctional UDP-N-acetylglucosamine diphosphorylase/glucosamine-1-phosphate N-acetyltransferase GlmU [Endomicrobiales bacterium]|nr:bifunctional UDP-N-acetylglucosamine diphosphorylase/glucosamine-1-phosphate N-acetyltransferase GlmU [Endomicrobiales bacterium]